MTAAPPGWDYVTDNSSYVDWFSTDSNDPFTHDIAPGGSLGGFAVGGVVATSEGLSFAAMSWDRSISNSGPSVVSTVKARSILSFAPMILNLSYSPEKIHVSEGGIFDRIQQTRR